MGGILFVCTANQIRSPFAERLMHRALHARFGPVADAVAVTSAGTHATPGQPIWPEAAAELARRGVSAAGHTARQLVPTMIRRSTVVLTAARTHRDDVTSLWPDALHRTFTLREIAWLLDGCSAADLPGRRLTERVEMLPVLARSRRGILTPLSPDAFDVADPVGGTDADYARAAVEIEQAIAVPLRVLRAERGVRP